VQREKIMSGQVGADLATLRALHKTFQQKAQDANQMKSAIDSGVHNAVWVGNYANQFRTAWQEYKRNLDRLHEALQGAAEDVKKNHNNQALASGEHDRI